jgi:hypothetical protein
MTPKICVPCWGYYPQIHDVLKLHTLNLFSDRMSLKHSFSSTSSSRFCNLSLTNTSIGIRHINLPFATFVVQTTFCLWVYLKICAQLSRPLLPAMSRLSPGYLHPVLLPHSAFVTARLRPRAREEF